jgi:hypothetical protein
MRYRLRTLLMVLAVGPPVLAEIVPVVIGWLQPDPLILEAGSWDRRSSPPILFSPNRPDLILYWLEHPSASGGNTTGGRQRMTELRYGGEVGR